MATPYVISSDLVSAYPAKSLEIAQYIDGFKADLALVQNAQTGTTYSFVAADFTKLVTFSNASPVAVTLPLEATVAWPAGTTLRLLNQGAGTVTVAGAVGVTINGTPLTLAQYKGAALIKTGTDTWTFAPFSSGVGAADFSDAATGSYSGYKYLTFTASGTITITTAGFADILVVGGAGGGGTGNATNVGGGGGGGGGVLVATNVYLAVGTLTCTVGAGGASAALGNTSRLDSFYSPGGGSGGTASIFPGLLGGSGGGGTGSTGTGGTGVTGIGNNGGSGAGLYGGGGGGGGSAAGANATSASVAGNGGEGTTNAYDNVSTVYGSGGGGAVNSGTQGTGGTNAGNGGDPGTAGTANRGGGGGGSRQSTGGAGGSGIVIVKVAV